MLQGAEQVPALGAAAMNQDLREGAPGRYLELRTPDIGVHFCPRDDVRELLAVAQGHPSMAVRPTCGPMSACKEGTSGSTDTAGIACL
jgi:hypothetical protein